MIRGMEKHDPELEDDLLPEYDLATLKAGVRGKNRSRNHRAEARLPSAEAPLIPVTCRCGQSFNVHVGNHPAKVSCHVCGHKMIVAQRGDIVHLANGETEASADNVGARVNTAICVMPPTSASTAITDPIHLEAFTASAPSTEARDQVGLENELKRIDLPSTEARDQVGLENELKRIDLDWQVEQLKYQVGGHWTLRSSLIAVNVVCVVIILVITVLAIYLAFWSVNPSPCLGILFAPGLVAAFGSNAYFLARHRAEYRQAEAAYRRQRRAALARYSGL